MRPPRSHKETLKTVLIFTALQAILRSLPASKQQSEKPATKIAYRHFHLIGLPRELNKEACVTASLQAYSFDSISQIFTESSDPSNIMG